MTKKIVQLNEEIIKSELIEQTLTYADFPFESRIRTNNVIERLNREIRRRTRAVGTFPVCSSDSLKRDPVAGSP